MSLSIRKSDISNFTSIYKDYNPIHFDDSYCIKNKLFKEKIVPGMLVSSYFSTLIGNKIPGHGSIFLRQIVNYKKPIYQNEPLNLSVKIKNFIIKDSIFVLEIKCLNQKKEISIDGAFYVKNNLCIIDN